MNVPLLTLESATDEQAAFLRRVPPINLFALLAHAPDLGRRLAGLGSSVMEGDIELRELIAIRIGWRLGGGYVMAQHLRVAALCGVKQEIVDLATGCADMGASSLHRDVAALADTIAVAGALDGALAGRIEQQLGRSGLVSLVVTAAYFAMLSGITRAFALPLEPMPDAPQPQS